MDRSLSPWSPARLKLYSAAVSRGGGVVGLLDDPAAAAWDSSTADDLQVVVPQDTINHYQ